MDRDKVISLKLPMKLSAKDGKTFLQVGNPVANGNTRITAKSISRWSEWREVWREGSADTWVPVSAVQIWEVPGTLDELVPCSVHVPGGVASTSVEGSPTVLGTSYLSWQQWGEWQVNVGDEGEPQKQDDKWGLLELMQGETSQGEKGEPQEK